MWGGKGVFFCSWICVTLFWIYIELLVYQEGMSERR